MAPKRRCDHCGQVHRKVLATEQRWIDEYIVHLNATRATETSYPATGKKNLTKMGWAIRQRPAVQCGISRTLGEQRERTQIRADQVLSDLTAIARFDLADVFDAKDQIMPVRKWPRWARQIVSTWKVDKDGNVSISFPDRLRAYEMLGRYHKLWTDVLQVGGELTLRERMSAGRRKARGREEES